MLTLPALAQEAEPPSNEELSRRVDVLAEELERQRIGESAPQADLSEAGLGPSASKVYRGQTGVSLGGYGELKYHRYADRNQAGDDAGVLDEIDAHRIVLYAGYKFDDRWVLNTEIEFEHIYEVSVEFAYLDYEASPALRARAGLLLVPMGFTNELHEPTTFNAVDRPQLERYLLPTTWREIGAGVHGDVGPFTYRAYLIDGLAAEGFSSAGIRGGRQKGAEAAAEDFAGVARLDFVGLTGLVVGGSAYYGDSGQTLTALDVPTLIYEGHASLDIAGLRARALVVGASLDGVAALNEALGLQGAASVGEAMFGYLAELGYDVLAPLGVSRQSLTPHLRYESLDTQASVPAGYALDPAQSRSVLTAGAAWKPQEQIVLKVDYQIFTDGAETGVNQLNVGVGYIF